jgi:hypothetical protein
MAQVKNAKRSTSARTRGPKAADVKGVQGHTLAQSIILAAIKSGERVIAEQRSRKDTLRLLAEFRDNADHIAFRQDLTAKLEEIKADADKAKLTLNAYCEANPIAASVRVECSLWGKMSNAVEKGFTGSLIDFDKPWSEISKAATAHLDNMRNSTGDAGANGGGKITNAGPKQRKGGRKAKPIMDKAKDFVKATLKDAPKDNRNLAEVVHLLILDATVQEIKEVAAVVEKQLALALAAEEAAAKAAAKGGRTAKKAAVPDTPKGDKPEGITPESIDRAQASTGRRAKAKA